MRQARWITHLAVLSLLCLGWTAPALAATCTPKFAVGINVAGGPPPGAPKQWPIRIDGKQVGVTNNSGSLQVTTAPGTHQFSTSASWTYKGKYYNYAGSIKKSVACNTWQILIPVQKR